MYILPILAAILIFILFFNENRDFIRSSANTWFTFTVISWLSIEILGWFFVWTKVTVSAVWILTIIGCLALLCKKKCWNTLKECGCTVKHEVCNLYQQHRFVCVVTLVFIAAIAGASVLRSPDNGDSMTYHLPRIMHWIQNKSTRYYGAGTDIQNRYPALSEYLVGQLLVLGANDRLANLFQLAAYFLAGGFVYKISRRIHVSKRMSCFSTWVFWCTPMAMAQAFSTQTDNIAGCFLMMNIYFLLDFIQAEKLKADKSGLLAGVQLAISIMFGYLCKPTICFAILVFFIWMCIRRICCKDSFVVLLKYVLIGICTAVVVYTPLLAKNHDVIIQQKRVAAEQEANAETDNGLTDISAQHLTNALAPDNFNVVMAIKDPRKYIIDCAQNIARNSGSAYFTQWNAFTIDIINKLGSKLEQDTGTYTVYDGKQFWSLDYATAPALMLLSFLSVMLFLLRISKPGKEQSVFVVCAILSFLLQCGFMGFTMARSRYLIGVMALLSIMVGVVIDNLKCSIDGRRYCAVALLTVCTFGAVNTYYYQAGYTIDSFRGDRCHKYFMSYDVPEKLYNDLTSVIEQYNFTRIAIDGNLINEYVLWKKVPNLERLECVNLKDSLYGKTYAAYEDMSYHPECLIKKTEEEQRIGQMIECHGVTYKCAWIEEPYDQRLNVYVGLYIPEE